MERELLQHFLRSGPARKFDTSAVSRRMSYAGTDDGNFLFQTSYCSKSILFKVVHLDDASGVDESSDAHPISMLVYFPYDCQNPGDGGESFLFSEDNVWSYFKDKMRKDDIDMPALRRDYQQLMIFDSVPTFSPFILELAFERAGKTVPRSYFDIPPDLRAKLREHIKARIRPLTVKALAETSHDTECLIETMTEKLFSLRSIAEIKPLIDILRIQEYESLRLFSGWIGITYFEYEYAKLQDEMKKFALWLIDFSLPRETLRPIERNRIVEFVGDLRKIMSGEWAEIVKIWKEYVESYDAYVRNNDADRFSKFLRNCHTYYWRLAEILGKLEQTLLCWRSFTRNYFNTPMPHYRLMEFYGVLKRLHFEEVIVQPHSMFERALFARDDLRL